MRVSISPSALMAVFLCFAYTTTAFWRMPCRTRSAIARIDPLVSNGSISQHVHAIHGSGGFSESASYEDLIASSCTSCQVTQDKSAYWTPALYFQSSSGQFTLVEQVGGMLAYYLLYPNAGNKTLSGFPAGFQMIAGNTNHRNFSDYAVPDIQKSLWYQPPYNTQAFLEQAAVGFNCLNYAKTPEGSLYRHFMPDKSYLDANCADGIRLELMFPSCWTGETFEVKDQKSHMAYPSQVMTGECPSGFPIRLPSLFYETIWNTAAFIGQAGQFVLANGDPTGYGYHGDFMMGWDPAFLQDAVNQCTNPSGQIQDCPLFKIQAEDTVCNATLPVALETEHVLASIPALPGNVPIVSGPGPASGATAGSPVTGAPPAPSSIGTQVAPVPTLPYSAGSSVASTDSYKPGGIFAVSIPTTPASVASTTSVSVTQAPPVATPLSNTESFFSTQYTTSGNNVLEVLWVEEVVTVTDPVTTTVMVPGRKRHVGRHVHQAVH